MLVENLSSKIAEFYLRGINKIPDKWQEVIQNDAIIIWYYYLKLIDC